MLDGHCFRNNEMDYAAISVNKLVIEATILNFSSEWFSFGIPLHFDH